MKKSEKHYTPWSLEESKLFIKLYLDEVKKRDTKRICKDIAQQFERTNSAVEIRVKEVAKILSGDLNVYPIVTPHMTQAVEEALEENGISRQKMLYWFE
jgi:precorrin-3B methylase